LLVSLALRQQSCLKLDQLPLNFLAFGRKADRCKKRTIQTLQQHSVFPKNLAFLQTDDDSLRGQPLHLRQQKPLGKSGQPVHLPHDARALLVRLEAVEMLGQFFSDGYDEPAKVLAVALRRTMYVDQPKLPPEGLLLLRRVAVQLQLQQILAVDLLGSIELALPRRPRIELCAEHETGILEQTGVQQVRFLDD
jgi:hypothetical protein